MLTVDDMKTDKKMPKRRRTCMECSNYRPLSFTDDGSDAWCGRCTIPAPSGKRLRAVRDAMSPACDEFREKGDRDESGAGKA